MNETVSGLELTCREVIDFILAYLEGELPPRERAIFEAHLALCQDCQNYLDSYRATVERSKQALANPPRLEDLPEIPPDLVQAILAVRHA